MDKAPKFSASDDSVGMERGSLWGKDIWILLQQDIDLLCKLIITGSTLFTVVALGPVTC